MVARKSALESAPKRPDLEQLLQTVLSEPITEEMLKEQRISFVYGNAPAASRITKESARTAVNSILLARA